MKAPKISDKNFRLTKSTKRLLSTMDGTLRSVFKKAMIGAEVSQAKNPRMTMMYDILPNGRKTQVKQADA